MRREQEEITFKGCDEISDHVARRGIASKRHYHVFCGSQRSAEGTFGPLQTCQVPLRLPHARGRGLEKTWYLSEVQNEISKESCASEAEPVGLLRWLRRIS